MLSLTIKRIAPDTYTLIGTHAHAGDITLQSPGMPLKQAAGLLKDCFSALAQGVDLIPSDPGHATFDITSNGVDGTLTFILQGCSRCSATGWTPHGRCFRCLGTGNSAQQESLRLSQYQPQHA